MRWTSERLGRVLVVLLPLGIAHCVMHTDGVAVALAVRPASPTVLDARGRELRVVETTLRVAGAELEPCDALAAMPVRVAAVLAPSVVHAHALESSGAFGVLPLAAERGAEVSLSLDALPAEHCALRLDVVAGEDGASMAMEIEREDRGRLSLVSAGERHLRLPLRGADGAPRRLLLGARDRSATIAIDTDWGVLEGIDLEEDALADRALERLVGGLRAVLR